MENTYILYITGGPSVKVLFKAKLMLYYVCLVKTWELFLQSSVHFKNFCIILYLAFFSYFKGKG